VTRSTGTCRTAIRVLDGGVPAGRSAGRRRLDREFGRDAGKTARWSNALCRIAHGTDNVDNVRSLAREALAGEVRKQ